MVKRHQDSRLAKVNRSYKVDEVAELYGVHKNTVLNWIKQGLPTLDNLRPLMICGCELKAFHKKRKVKNRHPCCLEELFCMRCKVPKKPVEGLVEFKAINEKTGNIIGICPVCGTLMYKRINIVMMSQFSAQMRSSLAQAHSHIVDSD